MSAEISITMFFLAIVVGLITFPLATRLSRVEWLDMFLRRICWVMALFIMSLLTAVMASIATAAGYTINKELFTILWILQWGSYLGMLALFLSVLFTMLDMWKVAGRNKRMGGDNEEH